MSPLGQLDQRLPFWALASPEEEPVPIPPGRIELVVCNKIT
jgi:hypothetical protein